MTSNLGGADATGHTHSPANAGRLATTAAVGGATTRLVPDEAGEPAAGADDFIRVSDARERFFGGAMSLRWWYRQIELGRLPHYRAGGAVLLRPDDVAAFVTEMFRGKTNPAPGSEPVPPVPAPPPKRRSGRTGGGLRFFTD